MQISEAGISLIKTFEGLRLSSYTDSVGIWTIGYGHTHGVHAGMVITMAQAEQFLRDDLVPFESYIAAVVKVTLSQKMFDALTSSVYNVGQGNLAKSSLLRLLNLGDYQSAADGFLLWNRAGGIVVAGLTKRREMERALFLQGVADLQNASSAPASDSTDSDSTDSGDTSDTSSDASQTPSDPLPAPDPVPDTSSPDSSVSASVASSDPTDGSGSLDNSDDSSTASS